MKTVSKVSTKLALIVLLLIIIPLQNIIGQNSFYVYFKQDGKRINIKKNKVELKKKPFTIFVEYIQPVDLYINASNKAKTYNQAQKGKLLFEMSGFNNIKDSEDFFVNKGTINMFKEKTQIWKKGKTEGGEMIKTEKNHFVVKKYIEKLYSVDEKRMMYVKDIDKMLLHMVFIYAEKDSDGEFQEIQREIVKIKWVNIYNEETKSYARMKKIEGKAKIRQAKRNLKLKKRNIKREAKRLKKLEAKKIKNKRKEKKKKNKQDSEKK